MARQRGHLKLLALFSFEAYRLIQFNNRLLLRQADFRRPLIAEVFVHSHIFPREICGGQRGAIRVRSSPAFSAICY